jgi:transposase
MILACRVLRSSVGPGKLQVTACGRDFRHPHGKILALVGSIDRFRSAAAFASYTDTAPIEASSGDVVRHRLSRAGKSHREALRCLKRRLSNAVYRRLVRDAHPDSATGPGGHPGATTKSSAAGSTPTTDSSDKSLPGPADTDPTNPTTRST